MTKTRTRLFGAASVVAAFAAILSGCSTGSGGDNAGSDPATVTVTASGSGNSASGSGSQSPTAPASSSYSGPVTKVHVTSVLADGATVGIGMPIVLKFSPQPTDSTAFTKAAKVTVNGQPAVGAWFWEQPTADDKKTHTIEAHYRMKTYWPANADIQVALPIGGVSAGTGLVYDDKLTSITFQTGDAHISMVDGVSHKMVVRSNNKTVKTVPVSLGKAKTRTYGGVKIVMQKGEDAADGKPKPNGTVHMVGPGYNEAVQWSVRITASGEYVHAAPWNSHIGQLSTSNGCTNLSTADAKWFYGFSLIGDVLQYVNTGGTKMPSWDGYGDWNVNWLQWQQGGLLLNH